MLTEHARVGQIAIGDGLAAGRCHQIGLLQLKGSIADAEDGSLEVEQHAFFQRQIGGQVNAFIFDASSIVRH